MASRGQKWTEEEDERLRAAVMGTSDEPERWSLVAKSVKTRSPIQCSQRWERVLKPGIVKGCWTEEEDALLVYLVSKNYTSWVDLAYHIPGRTSKQCRERWHKSLDPSFSRDPFSPEEDSKILTLYKQIGNKWSKIAKELERRTDEQVRERFRTLAGTRIKRKRRSDRQSLEADEVK